MEIGTPRIPTTIATSPTNDSPKPRGSVLIAMARISTTIA